MAFLGITGIPAKGPDDGVDDAVPGMVLPPIVYFNVVSFSDNLPNFSDGSIYGTDSHCSASLRRRSNYGRAASPDANFSTSSTVWKRPSRP